VLILSIFTAAFVIRTRLSISLHVH